MNVRRANLLLRTAAVSLVLLAGAILTAALTPPDESADDLLTFSSTRPTSRATPTALPPLPEFQAVWNRRLRPSFDGPPPADEAMSPITAPAAAAVPPIGYALVGTIGQSIALIRDATGSVEARSVGEEVAGMGMVIAVRPSEVDIRNNGQLLTLRRLPDTNPIQTDTIDVRNADAADMPDDPEPQAIVDGNQRSD